jgi:hypothetical protein
LERRWSALAALGGIVLAATALRFHRLGALPLWSDEGATLRFARKSFAQLWGPDAVRETNPPLFYSLQRLWLVLGASETALRSLAALLGVATVVLTYLLASGLAPPDRRRRVGLLAAALCALSTLQITYAQEARAYNLMTACALGVLVCLSALLRRPTWACRPLLARGHVSPEAAGERRHAHRLWGGYAVCTILLLYSHNTAVVLVALVQMVAIAWWLTVGKCSRDFAVNWLFYNAIALIAWSWWLPKIAHQAHYQLKDWWIPPPTAAALWETTQDLFLPMHLASTKPVGAAVVALGVLLGLFAWRRRPLALTLSAGMTGGGLLLLFALSYWRPMFLTRAVLWAGVPILVLIAAGVMALRPKPLRWALTACLLLLWAKNTHTYYRYAAKPAWDQAAHFVQQHDQPDDLLVFIWAHHDCAFAYYYPEDAPNAPRRIGLVGDDRQHFNPHDPGLAYITLQRLPFDALPDLASNYRTLWIITDQPTNPQSQWLLDQLGPSSAQLDFPGRIRILTFGPAPTPSTPATAAPAIH